MWNSLIYYHFIFLFIPNIYPLLFSIFMSANFPDLKLWEVVFFFFDNIKYKNENMIFQLTHKWKLIIRVCSNANDIFPIENILNTNTFLSVCAIFDLLFVKDFIKDNPVSALTSHKLLRTYKIKSFLCYFWVFLKVFELYLNIYYWNGVYVTVFSMKKNCCF